MVTAPVDQRTLEGISAIQSIASTDPMNRGFVSHIQSASLVTVGELLLSAKSVWIVTGFPILSARIGENDGPPGAVNIAYALEQLGKEVTLITDHYSYPLVQVATKVAGCCCPLENMPLDTGAMDVTHLLEHHPPEVILTIERPSKGEDGRFHNMKGKDISSMTADTDLLLTAVQQLGLPTIAIGDGGNEWGMGVFLKEITQFVPHGREIAAISCCDYPLVGGISNYFGWGIAGALSLLSHQPLLLSEEIQHKILDEVSAVGGVDGTKGVVASSVDGQSRAEYLEVYRRIQRQLDAL